MSLSSVVYVITKLELGGAQKICLSLFQEINKQDTPTYLITGDNGILVDTVKNLPNTFFLASLKRELRWYRPDLEIKTFFSMLFLLRKLKKKHPHLIVHTHGSKAGVIGRLAAFFAGVKKRIHTVHGFPFHPHQKKIAWLAAYCAEFLCAPFTTQYICVSQPDATTGKRLLPGFKKKYSLIRAAIDTQHFFIPALHATISPHGKETFVFGTISCMKPQKNILDMLKAFALVHAQNPRTRLEIIGDGVERTFLQDWLFKNNLTDAVLLHGWQTDVRPFLKKWHCFVLSSLWEGLPCAAVEARLAHLPIICYDTGGLREIIHHGVNGFVYPQRNWTQLAQGMLALSTDELLFVTVRNYPDNFKDFDLSVMIDKHKKLYTAIGS